MKYRQAKVFPLSCGEVIDASCDECKEEAKYRVIEYGYPDLFLCPTHTKHWMHKTKIYEQT
jgi:hypothetical protein